MCFLSELSRSRPKMQAVVCEKFGPPSGLKVQSIDVPQAGYGDVVIDVFVSGVAFTDWLMVQNKVSFLFLVFFFLFSSL
jgi:NADPH:quinone reductase-like Zn-dependent oxidoreductase